LGNDKFAPYGVSILDPARRIFRQLDLLENAMMAYRIVRSPERRVFYIDVGNIPPKEVEQYMQKIVVQMKRNQVVDANTGRVDLRYNPQSIDEDYFIPVRGGASNSRIDTLPGGQYTGDINDVEYLRDKLFSALKIPMSYLSRGKGSSEDKTTLAQKDIRFARTIQRLQRSIVTELEKIGRIHLYMLGFKGEDLINFSLCLNNPSKIAQLQELEHWRTKFDVASAATEGIFSRRWIEKKLFNLSDEEIIRNERERFHDASLDSLIEVSGETPISGIESSMDVGIEDEEAELTPEEEEVLLASPESDELLETKEDGSYLTKGAKGKFYKPEITDKRNMGARKRHLKSQYGSEAASSTRRNTFKGYNELSSLIGGLKEEKESIYKEEEKKIIDMDNELKILIKELDNRKK
jgi:hypothetical protein